MSGNFDKSIIDKVWSKGIIVKGYDEALFRKDCCGAWIVKMNMGNRVRLAGR